MPLASGVCALSPIKTQAEVKACTQAHRVRSRHACCIQGRCSPWGPDRRKTLSSLSGSLACRLPGMVQLPVRKVMDPGLALSTTAATVFRNSASASSLHMRILHTPCGHTETLVRDMAQLFMRSRGLLNLASPLQIKHPAHRLSICSSPVHAESAWGDPAW